MRNSFIYEVVFADGSKHQSSRARRYKTKETAAAAMNKFVAKQTKEVKAAEVCQTVPALEALLKF